MIVGFNHKGLRLLYEKGDRSKVLSQQTPKVERILARLDVATGPDDMNLPGYRLHPLSGDRAGYWSVSVTRNWRIVFRFDGVHVCDVDMVDYH